jgi:hypothetical protein
MICLKIKENLLENMDKCIKDNGKMVNRMDKELSLFISNTIIRVNFQMARWKVLVL